MTFHLKMLKHKHANETTGRDLTHCTLFPLEEVSWKIPEQSLCPSSPPLTRTFYLYTTHRQRSWTAVAQQRARTSVAEWEYAVVTVTRS